MGKRRGTMQKQVKALVTLQMKGDPTQQQIRDFVRNAILAYTDAPNNPIDITTFPVTVHIVEETRRYEPNP